jgi:L-threonylcarbamoyladenylate synthase
MIVIKKPDNKILKEVANQLKCGAVIVYPTDTAYGLGCDATNTKAVAKIFKIKGRAASKALPLIVADAKMARKFFLLTTHYSLLTKKYWPGPLSIVLKAKRGIAKAALQAGTAAVRVPDSDVARELSRFLGRPLIATSANLSGQPACYSVRALTRQFTNPAAALSLPSPRMGRGGGTNPPLSGGGWPQAGRGQCPDVVLDAGVLPRRKPSTIVRLGKSGTIEVLRQGSVKIR